MPSGRAMSLMSGGRSASFNWRGSIENLQALVSTRRLYVWKDPQPVAMAAWVCPTPHGGCINFVYTPPEFRGKGHGTAVVAALARHLFANGTRFCFILTDPADHRTNHIYQKVGARTLCELARCTIGRAKTPAASRMAAQQQSN
jgi:predicted GNAT family acetyltransferase